MDCQHNIRTKLDGKMIGFDRCEECGAHVLRGSINDEVMDMRGIKLKAWDRESKHMMSWREVIDCCQDIGVRRFFESGNFIKLQYIGHQDSTQEDIFENDILSQPGGRKFQVVWDNDRGGWAFKSCFAGQQTIFPLVKQWIESATIVGNIYETPDQLKN